MKALNRVLCASLTQACPRRHYKIIDERRSERFCHEVGTLNREDDRPAQRPTSPTRRLPAVIGDAMAQLSTEHRAVIRRSYYQGWSTSEIARDLGIAEATAKSRLHYAMRALRLSLQEME